MAECKDCIHFCVCSTYTAPNESYPEVGGCPAFKNSAEFVRVVQEPKGVEIDRFNKWISVKDRLPEEMRAVIVWTKDRAMGEAWLAEDGFEWCESGERADVTHWMPMPQPPKGE